MFGRGEGLKEKGKHLYLKKIMVGNVLGLNLAFNPSNYNRNRILCELCTWKYMDMKISEEIRRELRVLEDKGYKKVNL